MTFAREMLTVQQPLLQLGHTVILPDDAASYAGRPDRVSEKWQVKQAGDLIRNYFHEIERADAVLVLNYTKHDVVNYIGGNAFLEIGFAHILDKQVYLLNPIPDMLYTDEIRAMRPTIINGDLSKVVAP